MSHSLLCSPPRKVSRMLGVLKKLRSFTDWWNPNSSTKAFCEGAGTPPDVHETSYFAFVM